MPRHRRMLAPINANKHYVHRTNATFTSGSINNNVLVDAVFAPANTNAFDVEEGSVVKAIHIEHWLQNEGASGTSTQCTYIVEKVPSNQAAVSAAQLANLGGYPNKKNILFSFQGNLSAAVDGAPSVNIANGWLLIPKGKQRMGLGDRLVASFTSVGESVNICGLATYKEFR